MEEFQSQRVPRVTQRASARMARHELQTIEASDCRMVRLASAVWPSKRCINAGPHDLIGSCPSPTPNNIKPVGKHRPAFLSFGKSSQLPFPADAAVNCFDRLRLGCDGHASGRDHTGLLTGQLPGTGQVV